MQVFPDFRGLAYPVGKAPLYSTTVQETVSGKEIRFGSESMPRLTFKLSFNFLTKSDYETILTFYHQHRGQLKSFLFLDKTDNEVYEVRFRGESDYEKFSHELWQLKTLELITVK